MGNDDNTRSTSGHKVRPAYMKTGAAAQYLGISRRYLCQLAQEGAIKHSKIGARTQLFARNDLDGFVENYAVGGREIQN